MRSYKIAHQPKAPCAGKQAGRPDCSVVVPVYNSASSLPLLLSKLCAALKGLSFEIIFVDDASRDGSWAALQALRRGHKGLRILRLQKNSGQHRALWRGFQLCRGRWVVTLDDDLQNSPQDIPRLLKALRNKDLVYGWDGGSRHRGFRRWTSRCGRILVGMAAPRLHPRFGSFRAMRRETLQKALAWRGGFVDAPLCREAARIGWVAVKARPRPQGRSGYPAWKLLGYGLSVLWHTWFLRRGEEN